MNYDVSSLVQEVKQNAKDTSLPDSQIIRWLQSTQDRVLGHRRFPMLESSLSQSLNVGDLTLAYPSDLQVILGIKLIEGTQATTPEYLAFNVFDDEYPLPEEQAPTRPCHFTDYANELYWNAPLDRAYQLQLKYLRKPVRFTSGSVVPDIPAEFRDILYYGGMAAVEANRENFDIEAVHLRKVEDLAEDLVVRYSARQIITPHRVKGAILPNHWQGSRR